MKHFIDVHRMDRRRFTDILASLDTNTIRYKDRSDLEAVEERLDRLVAFYKSPESRDWKKKLRAARSHPFLIQAVKENRRLLRRARSLAKADQNRLAEDSEASSPHEDGVSQITWDKLETLYQDDLTQTPSHWLHRNKRFGSQSWTNSEILLVGSCLALLLFISYQPPHQHTPSTQR